jgi:hypothetical protein
MMTGYVRNVLLNACLTCILQASDKQMFLEEKKGALPFYSPGLFDRGKSEFLFLSRGWALELDYYRKIDEEYH